MKFNDYLLVKQIVDAFPRHLRFVEGRVSIYNKKSHMFEDVAPMGAPQPDMGTQPTAAPGTAIPAQAQAPTPTAAQPANANPQQDLGVVKQMQQLVAQFSDKQLASIMMQAIGQVEKQLQGGQQIQQAPK
jgi:hypothetical protein